MTHADCLALLPWLVQAGAVLFLLVIVCIGRNHLVMATASAASSVAVFATLPTAAARTPHHIGNLLIIDDYALFYLSLILIGTFSVTILAYDYLERHGIRKEEFYILLQAATTGAAVLAATTHFVAIFLGLELLSVSLYGMIAYIFVRPNSLEAAAKYLVLAAAASAFLLMGMALLYADSGLMTLEAVGAGADGRGIATIVLLGGTALFVVGVGFKLALVPFHLWIPDIYQGAPVPVTTFLATVSKGAMVSLLLRFALTAGEAGSTATVEVFAILAVASMLAGNLLALRQDNVSRVLAYSSIAHLGYVLVAVVAGGAAGAEAVAFYLASYLVTTVGAFGVISLLSTPRRDFSMIGDFSGLFWRRPGIALVFTAMLLSLAGLPLTGGFVGKFLLVSAGVRSSAWLLVITLVVGSVIGLFYYLRIVAAMFSDRPATAKLRRLRASNLAGVLLAVGLVIVVLLGVHPGPVVALIRSMIFPLS